VLGPLLFLIYINDIGVGIKNNLRLFADDALLFGPVSNAEERQQMLSDLNKLEGWAAKWQMVFNASKCEVLHFTPKAGNESLQYRLDNTVLKSVTRENTLA
jgi:hypothetical protein